MRACGRSLLLCVFVPIAALFDSERRRFRPAHQTARALKLLFALFVLQAFESFAAPCIWFADANSVKQINTDDNSIVVEVPMPAPRRLVMNDNDCSVWALRQSDRRLIKLDAAGSQVGNVDVTLLDPGLTAALRVRLDPFDNSLWVTDTRHVSHFNADATVLLGSFTTPADIKRLRIGMDQKLWVLGKRKLWRYNRQGKQLEERALDPV